MKNIILWAMVTFGIHSDSVMIKPDRFYYNRTSTGMESGTIIIDYYHLEIHHGTHIEFHKFVDIEYDEEEQEYTFLTEKGKVIHFEPDMHMITVDKYVYFINSTINTNW